MSDASSGPTLAGLARAVWDALAERRRALAVYLIEGRAATCSPTLTLLEDDMAAREFRGPRSGRLVITPSYHKLVDVVLCLLHEADRLGVVLTQYDIVKSTFFADRRVLNRFGVPITFDAYWAMEHGPVPIMLYNLLKGDPRVIRKTGEVQWSSRRRPGSEGVLEFREPRRPVDEDVLDGVEVDELREALRKVVSLGVSAVRRETHEDPAYVAAWRRDSEATAFAMSYEKMLDAPDEDLLSNLAHASGQVA